MKNLILLLLFFLSPLVYSQSLISWTEQNGTLGLGYPVPVPVETTEAFDGFRTYNGLFTKHQSLALNNDYITGHVVGHTRNNRDIWAYVLSDGNDLTKYGVKEGGMMINGAIHAREWQTPEVLTGIMELLSANSQDNSLHQYLLENTKIIAIPVNNVDGFLQTQRYPKDNWYNSLNGSPRDGRMRRKNMLEVDEILSTESDHKLGVDLNRNNDPYWATSLRSSFDDESIVYHGQMANSEPETQARISAVELLDGVKLRVYTDVHSFSKVHFSHRTRNQDTRILMQNLLLDFSLHHLRFPKGVFYLDRPSGPASGIGSTDEYFAETYQVPSWTLEVEPGSNGAVEYGGFGRNGHDGFILPESEITRVREQLAQSFMVAWYGQAGPPSITQIRAIEKDTGIVVYDASWDIKSDGLRELFVNEIENLVPGSDYDLFVSFDKPMRHRDENGQIIKLQGQNESILNPVISTSIGSSVEFNNPRWLDDKDGGQYAYKYYKDDTFVTEFTIDSEVVLNEDARLTFSINVADMIGQNLDSNPATVATWIGGSWQGYEDTSGDDSIVGGVDQNYTAPISHGLKNEFIPAVQPTALFFDPSRNGEGFNYELLEDNLVLVQWYTYDDMGRQRWYTGVGSFSANSIVVDQLKQTSGGVFGLDFDSDSITKDVFGSLEILFSGGRPLESSVGFHDIVRDAKALFKDVNGNKLRTDFIQLTRVKGAVNHAEPFDTLLPIDDPVGLLTGLWFDPQRDGEGYIIEVLEDNLVILVVFTYDLEGNHMWLLGSGGSLTEEEDGSFSLSFNSVKIAEGGIFGEDFNPDDVVLSNWGSFRLQLTCEGIGTVSYQSSFVEFGEGSYEVVRLTTPLTIPYTCATK